MKLEQKDSLFLFKSTPLPDIFFTEYLNEAPGDYIKVYLYCLFLAKYKKEIKIANLSKTLSIHIKTIQDALTFWEKENVIIKKGNDYILNDLQELELNKLYSPNLSLSKEKIEDNAKNKSRTKIIDTINSMYFQGIMNPSWYSDIDTWFKKYNFDEDVMLALFSYCFEQSALHKNYITAVAEAWYVAGVKTFDDLDKHFEEKEKINKIKKNISKKLGLSRKLTQYEEGYIEKWFCDYNYNFDIIEIALKKTSSKPNFSFDYLDTMITDWKNNNLKTPDEIKNYLLEYKNKTKKVQELQKKTNYNNYEQRNITNFDNLYANV